MAEGTGEERAHLCLLEVVDLVELILQQSSKLSLVLVIPVAGGGARLREKCLEGSNRGRVTHESDL